MAEGPTNHALLSAGTYVRIWLALVVLTGATVTVAALQLGRFSVLVAIAIASLKAVLVVFFFMNLKEETWLFKVMLALALMTFATIMILTFLDLLYR